MDKYIITKNNDLDKSMYPSILNTNNLYENLEQGMTDLKESVYLFKVSSPSMKKMHKPIFNTKYKTRKNIYFSESRKNFDKTAKINSYLTKLRSPKLKYPVQNNNIFSPLKHQKNSDNSNNITNSIKTLRNIDNNKKMSNKIVHFPKILLKNEVMNTDINLGEQKINNNTLNKENKNIFLNGKTTKINNKIKTKIQNDKFNMVNNDDIHHILNSIYIPNNDNDSLDISIDNSKNSNDNNLNYINYNSAEIKNNDINKNRISVFDKKKSLNEKLSFSNKIQNSINNSISFSDKIEKKFIPKILSHKVRKFQLDNNKCNDLLNSVKKKHHKLDVELGSKFKYAKWKFQISDYNKYFIDTELYGEKEREEIESSKTFYDILEDLVDMVKKNQIQKKYLATKVESVNEQIEEDQDKRKNLFGKDFEKFRLKFLAKHLKKISKRKSMEKKKRDEVNKILNDSQLTVREAMNKKI